MTIPTVFIELSQAAVEGRTPSLHERVMGVALHETGHWYVSKMLGVETQITINVKENLDIYGSCEPTDSQKDIPASHNVMIAIAGHVTEAFILENWSPLRPLDYVEACFKEDPPIYLVDIPYNDAAKAGDIWRIYLPATMEIIRHGRQQIEAKTHEVLRRVMEVKP